MKFVAMRVATSFSPRSVATRGSYAGRPIWTRACAATSFMRMSGRFGAKRNRPLIMSSTAAGSLSVPSSSAAIRLMRKFWSSLMRVAILVRIGVARRSSSAPSARMKPMRIRLSIPRACCTRSSACESASMTGPFWSSGISMRSSACAAAIAWFSVVSARHSSASMRAGIERGSCISTRSRRMRSPIWVASGLFT